MKQKEVSISAPNFGVGIFKIKGTSPLVMNKFSKKSREQIRTNQKAGSRAKKGKKKEPKDFEKCYEEAFHRSEEGWVGMPAAAFRAAMVSACRLVGFEMTKAKLALFVEPDGIDADDRMPLVRIHGEPKQLESHVRLPGSTDIRIRPVFNEWSAQICVKFDADLFSEEDVANLLMRAGLQVGIGEGRPDSKKSTGLGWGLFEIA